MNIIYRKAERGDCLEMMQLIKELALFERAPEQVTVSFDQFVESGFGDKPVWWAYVAMDEVKIIGLCLYYIRYSTWKGQRLYLEDLIVTKSYRGKGIGKKLMDIFIAEAKSGPFTGAMWQALDWNTPALRFYESYGARADAEWINFHMDF